ncbi:hypothetical protein [Bradyrhizobium sp. sBnM-33]|uniref:hypothetical protein n=1 Tax=Bradyrhizobium sp. sBnM-33 TaxID=2831780 RepID=UPI001BCD823A|nr:hypothetical protein [Bradyrhizobium sp. sBnM-33]WOH52563.1 hypothetical protein RX328_10625 [Bradyrhizobium sp. sBnM-33]
MRLLMLVNTLDGLEENAALLTNAFRRFSCEVILGDINVLIPLDVAHHSGMISPTIPR